MSRVAGKAPALDQRIASAVVAGRSRPPPSFSDSASRDQDVPVCGLQTRGSAAPLLTAAMFHGDLRRPVPHIYSPLLIYGLLACFWLAPLAPPRGPRVHPSEQARVKSPQKRRPSAGLTVAQRLLCCLNIKSTLFCHHQERVLFREASVVVTFKLYVVQLPSFMLNSCITKMTYNELFYFMLDKVHI